MYNRIEMKLNKAHWSTTGENIRLSMPINKVDKERRIVSGFATLDNLDKQGDVVPAEASIKAFETFRGNLREMHQPIAVGKIVSFKEDKYFDPESKKFYNGVYVSAYVSKGAQNTWEKVLDGTLTGFSIGGEIHDADDIYDEDMDKAYRVIKDYSLSELSLVDNPANQFANVVSIEKGVATGYLSKAQIENVFWCREDDIVRMSATADADCPQCDKSMSNIGFVESDDQDKASVIKSMISGIKVEVFQKGLGPKSFVKFNDNYGKIKDIVLNGGVKLSSDEVILTAKTNDPVAIIQLYSQIDGTIVPTNRRVIKNISSLEKVNAISKSEVEEVSKMDSDIVVVDEIEKGADFDGPGSDDQINPDPTALPVSEETEKAISIEVEEEDDEEEMDEAAKAEQPEETKAEEPEVAKTEDAAVAPVEDATAKMINEISESLTSALSTLAETVKALDAKIEGINKSVAGVASKVEEVEDKFGKRVDAVEKDTAFRKSADLGEILQEEPVIVEKSTWGGRFLTNADLF